MIFSLIALLKIELASGMEVSNRIARALSAVNKQLTFLNAREDLDIPLEELLVGFCIHSKLISGGSEPRGVLKSFNPRVDLFMDNPIW